MIVRNNEDLSHYVLVSNNFDCVYIYIYIYIIIIIYQKKIVSLYVAGIGFRCAQFTEIQP